MNQFADEPMPRLFEHEAPKYITPEPNTLYAVTEDGRVFADLAMLSSVFIFVLEPQHDMARDSGDEEVHAYFDGALRVADGIGLMYAEVAGQLAEYQFSEVMENLGTSELFAALTSEQPTTDEGEASAFGNWDFGPYED